MAAGEAIQEEQRFVVKRRGLAFGTRIVGGIGAGLLLAGCFPPYGLPMLLPFALAGLLWLLEGVTVREGGYIGVGFGLTFFGGTLFWLFNLFGSAAVSLITLAAAFPALFAALFVGLRGRLPRVPVWLTASVVWTAIEFFRSEWMRPNFAWMGLGYAIVDAPVLAAPAAIFGSYGLTFALVLFAAALVEAGRRRNGKAFAALSVVWLALFLLPRSAPTPARSLTVRLVQANSEDEDGLFGLSQSKSNFAPQIIVWPEYSFVHDPTQDHKLWRQLIQVAQTQNVYFLFGAKDESGARADNDFRNTAWLLSPGGAVVGTHVKNHPVPFIRDGRAGTEAKAFSTALGRLGIGICFDMDFADVARRLTEDGAEVLLVPSDNPAEWGAAQHAQHRQMFQMRAIETGRWLATADVAGSTFVAAPNGRITSSVRGPEPIALDVVVGRAKGRTLFVVGGWRFGPLCLTTLLAFFVWALLPARFRRLSDAPDTRPRVVR